MIVPVFQTCSRPVPDPCSRPESRFAAGCSRLDMSAHTGGIDTPTPSLNIDQSGTLEQVQKEAGYSCSRPLEQPGTSGTGRRAPQCAICGGSGLDIHKPLPWGGYEACTHCLIPDGWSPEAHPGWRRHLPTGYAHRSPPAAPRRAPAAKVRPHHPQPQNARGEAPTASGAHRSHP